MLVNLTIENIAVIEKASVAFTAGMNVLTGETGAGKSIIIDSLNAVLGERVSRDLIRTGCEKASVTAEFDYVGAETAGVLDELGIDNGGNLIITRVMYADGRNTCRINGSPANVGMLKNVGFTLVNIHGQHDSQALLAPEKHCGFIDSLACNSQIKAEYKKVFSKLISVKRELDGLYTDETQKSARLEYLNFCINEIESAGINVGEREELIKRKEICRNAQKVVRSYTSALDCLTSESENGGAGAMLLDCVGFLGTASGISDEASGVKESANEVYLKINELISDIRSLRDSFDYDESMLEGIDERLDLIYRITHKYGGSEESTVEAYNSMLAEREKITLGDKRAEELEETLQKLSGELKIRAAELTKSRKESGRVFEERVMSELRFLDMPGVVFKVRIEPASFSSKGADSVEFLLSANPGEEPRPLSKIASGGELSRIMLAIKNVISGKDDIPTLIFDEIDTGVSGRAAQKIGMKLQELSNSRQVICVTHLAQLAARAYNHLTVYKQVVDGNTYTNVKSLDFEGRKNEIARINGGLEVTEIQLKNAEEMLLSAGIKGD